MDKVIMVVLAVILLVWVGYGLKKWLLDPASFSDSDIPINDYIPDHPAIDLLEKHGYEVIGGKIHIPLYFSSGQEEYSSRLFIDYVVQDEDEVLYMVKLARSRLPIEWTGSGLRERFLPYFLLYQDCAGLLYVDLEHHSIRKVTFDWDEEEWKQ